MQIQTPMKTLWTTGAWLLLVWSLLSCSTPTPPPARPAVITQTLVDDLGRTVTVPRHPLRILSLAPSNTEWVFALGAEARLVGRSEACDAPSEAGKIPSVGGLFPPDLERIIQVRPDLVLMIDGNPTLRATLTRMHIPVLVLQPQTVEGVFSDIRLLGRALDTVSTARTVEAKLRADVQRIAQRKRALAKRVFYEVWPEPLTSAGPKTFVGDLINRAGGKNIVDARLGSWPKIDAERVVQARPEVVFVTRTSGIKAFMARPEMQHTPAVQGAQVYAVPNPNWLARPGPQLVKGLAWLTDTLAQVP